MMDEATLTRLRPAGTTSADIDTALDAIRAEQRASRQRLADAQARRQDLFLHGTTAELRDAEEVIRDAERDGLRLDAMYAALEPKKREAAATEAGVKLQAEIDEASAAIEKFNAWYAKNYEKLALALKVGLELELDAERQRKALRNKNVIDALPVMTRSFVGDHPASLSFYTRLPAASPGPPIWWAT